MYSLEDYRKFETRLLYKCPKLDPVSHFMKIADNTHIMGHGCYMLSCLSCFCCMKWAQQCLDKGDMGHNWAASLKSQFYEADAETEADAVKYRRWCFIEAMNALRWVEDQLRGVPITSPIYSTIQKDLKDGTWVRMVFREIRFHLPNIKVVYDLESARIYGFPGIILPKRLLKDLCNGFSYFLPVIRLFDKDSDYVSPLDSLEIAGLREMRAL